MPNVQWTGLKIQVYARCWEQNSQGFCKRSCCSNQNLVDQCGVLYSCCYQWCCRDFAAIFRLKKRLLLSVLTEKLSKLSLISLSCSWSFAASNSIFSISGVASPKFRGSKSFDLGEKQYFVWDSASKSTKWIDMLNFLGSWPPGMPVFSMDIKPADYNFFSEVMAEKID